jgi:Protein of unknown function (DUF1501)
MTTRLGIDCERYHRRDFIKLGMAGLLGLGMADLLRLQARSDSSARQKAKAHSVIMIWLAGGPATIDMWDLKPEAPEEIRGEFKPIETSAPGVRICEHLARTAKVMDRCNLVRSVHHSIAAHGPGTVYLTTGNRPTPALTHPSLGSLASRLLPAPAGVPAYVTFGEGRAEGAANAGFLGTAYNPFEVEPSPDRSAPKVQRVSLPDGFTADELDKRDKLRERFDARFKALDESDLPASLDKFHQQALDILRADKTNKAFDLSGEPQATRERYGRGPLGQSALTARRLVEAGVRFVTVGLGGWDTHAANFRTLRDRLLPQVDQALSALITDLDEKGLLDGTIVYCAGEFGRTPRVNGAAGRDHWARSMAVFLAGGGLAKGCAYGSTDAHGTTPEAAPCSPDDVSATIFQALGIPPHHEVTTPSGRPVAIFREGKVLNQLLS